MISHEQIFQLAIGIYPEVGKAYFSPFRSNDKRPGVRFNYRGGYLRMYDHGSGIIGWNAYDLVAYKLTGQRIPSSNPERKRVFDQVMAFIKSHYGGPIKPPIYQEKKFEFQLEVKFSSLNTETLEYYAEHGITKENLIDDRVTGCEYYQYNTSMFPYLFNRHYPIGRCAVIWVGGSKKIARPGSFLTDCKQNDFHYWDLGGALFILGGYKDGRVMANLGCSAWAWQSESQPPDDEHFRKMFERHSKIYYIGDSDDEGIMYGKKWSGKYGLIHRPLPTHRKDIAEYRRINETEAKLALRAAFGRT